MSDITKKFSSITMVATTIILCFLNSACKPVEKKVPKVTDEEQKVLDGIDQQYQK